MAQKFVSKWLTFWLTFTIPLNIDRHTVTNKKDCITCFPLHIDGSEATWQLSNTSLEDALKLGYVKLGNLTERGVSIKYLNRKEINKIESGNIKVTGYDKNGAVITDDSTFVRQDIPGTQWRLDSHNARTGGTEVLKVVMPDRKFPFPKSVYAVEDVMRFFVANKSNALIVDFFAGSGTTSHAVMLLNHLDGGKRKSISITNNEIGPDTEKEFITKKKLRPTDAEWQKYGIAKYITWERIKAALTGINTKGEPIKGDYKFTEEFPMSEGFKENAIFFDLKYEDGKAIRLNMAFREIAPLLWMKAGCKGRMIDEITVNGYDISEEYAILFDFMASKDFIRDVKDKNIKVAYIVTDSEPLYQQIYKQLPKGVEPVRLYENYLTSFAIYGTA